jgi:mycofactocin biosynthesis protein MftB
VSDGGLGFDPGRPYRCSPRVALRPEPFGALVYHYGTRRLSFLKTPQLVEVVTGLERHPDVHSAIDAAGVAAASRPAYLRALAGLAESGTIEPRLDPGAAEPPRVGPGAVNQGTDRGVDGTAG